MKHLSHGMLFIATLLALGTDASAAAPMQKKQVPGYYRMMLGQFEVTALYDGCFRMDKKTLRGEQAEIDALLARRYVKGRMIPTSVNAFLVNTGKRLVLIDAGSGVCFGPALGKLLKNLHAAGYKPDQVDVVLITHLHGDHMGGLVYSDGKPVFANATVFVPAADHESFVKPAATKDNPTGSERRPSLAARIAAPYLETGKWKTFQAGDEPTPGIRAIAAAGHTPGHAAFEVKSGDATLLVWGDLVHCMEVQLAKPETAVRYDANAKKAVAARAAMLARLASHGTLIAGAHMPFPGLGRLRAKKDGGYDWVPVQFTVTKGPLPHGRGSVSRE